MMQSMSTHRSFPAWKANPTETKRRDRVRVGDVAFVVPGPMPTRDTPAADTERWARGVLRVDLSPAEEWYALRSTPLTPKGPTR